MAVGCKYGPMDHGDTEDTEMIGLMDIHQYLLG